jgi:hypothetical protein
MSIPAGILVFISNWWKLAVGIIVGALICYPFALDSGKDAGRKEIQLQVETANRQFLEQKARADELAARQRVIDQNAVNRQVEVLLNAIRDIPDSTPSAISIRLGCERLLRAAGGNPAAVPAVCRSQGGTQANPTP